MEHDGHVSFTTQEALERWEKSALDCYSKGLRGLTQVSVTGDKTRTMVTIIITFASVVNAKILKFLRFSQAESIKGIFVVSAAVL